MKPQRLRVHTRRLQGKSAGSGKHPPAVAGSSGRPISGSLRFPWPVYRQVNQIKDAIARSHFAQNQFVILVWRVFRKMGRDDATHLAAGVAYYAIFSLFPLLLGVLALLGMFLGSESAQQSFLDFVAGNLPGSEEFIESNLDEIVRFQGTLGIGAIFGLLWSGSAVFGAISRAVNRAWGIHQNRPFYIAKPRHIGMVLAVGILFLASVLASSIIQLLTIKDLGIPGQRLLMEIDISNLALRAIPWGTTFLIFLLVYRFVPNCRTYWRYSWPGALVAAVLFEIGKNLFLWYLANFAVYDQVYGQLASVMVLLFWAYISSLLLILGAQISSEFERLYLSTAAVGRPSLRQ